MEYQNLNHKKWNLVFTGKKSFENNKSGVGKNMT